MRFLNYGSVNIDLIFTVDHIVKGGGETLQSTSLTKSAGGGKGANQSAALAKAGAEVFHAGKLVMMVHSCWNCFQAMGGSILHSFIGMMVRQVRH